MTTTKTSLRYKLTARTVGCLIVAVLTAFRILPAQAAVIPNDTDYVKSLDGAWRFKLEQPGGYDSKSTNGDRPMPILLPLKLDPVQNLDYTEDNDWVSLNVPGNWEIAGLSVATYNQPDNASGAYRLWFDVPSSWEGREVRLAFDGVQNGAEFWLNGNPVMVDEPSWGRGNYHEGGWTAFQVDLTPQIKFGAKNLLAVRVTKNTRSADLDTGDYFFLGGIHRTVKLFSVPKTHVDDVTVQTRLLDGNRAEVKVLTSIAGNDVSTVSMQLKDVDGETETKIEKGCATLVQIVPQPKLWSAEFPNLYQLNLKLKDASGKTIEKISQRIGIREISIKNGVFLVNGVPVKMAGVCRHDVFPTEGTAVGPDLWRKDITLMKGANINAIRTSHYPYGAGFYDLCDELGMYVVDELPYCWCDTDRTDMRPAFEQRARETVRRDKNHPSVVAWTIGNENRAGSNLQVAADLVKQLDPTRPRNVSWFNGEKYHVEFDDSHYSPPSSFAKDNEHSVQTGQPHIHLENPNTWDVRLAADAGMWERWGTVMQREWDACYKYDTVPGLFPFEWQDRAVADHYPTKLYSYFPETGINLLKIKGLVDGFRNPRPSLYEVKMVYSPVQVGNTIDAATEDLSFAVTNRYSFTDLSYLSMAWTLQKEGKKVSSGHESIHVPALTVGKASIHVSKRALEKADALLVEFNHPDGSCVVGHLFTLKNAPAVSEMNSKLPVSLQIPRFNLVTRTTVRDRNGWREAKRTSAVLVHVITEPPNVKALADLKQLTADIMSGTNSRPVGKVRVQFSNGEFSYHLDWTGRNADVQELGWAFDMPGDCNHFSWNRAGRWTIYPPTHIGRLSGTALPDTMSVPLTRMDRPDAFDYNSTKYDCNWASLTSNTGAGLRVEFDAQQRFHCRGGVANASAEYTLFVNQQVSPPEDISRNVVSDYYLTLKPGSKIDGHFLVGSNQTHDK